jgi:large subunit ribosomal protein L25
MEISTLDVKVRDGRGKGASRQLRMQENIPAVVYGLEKDALSVSLNQKAFNKLVEVAGQHALVQLDVAENPELSGPTMIRGLQRHPIKDHIIHVDFLRIDLNKKLTTSVQVHLVGQAKGVVAGGVVDHQLREVEIECLAIDVPSEIKVSIANLDIGDSLHVSDLKVSRNITLVTDAEQVVASVHAPRALEEVVEEELEEGVEVPLVGEETSDEDE